MDSESGSDWEQEKKEDSGEREAAQPASPDSNTPEDITSPVQDEEADETSTAPEEAKEKSAEEKSPESNDDEEKKNGHPASSLPRELHRTASIFLRNLAPTITKLEVEAVRVHPP